MGPPSDPNNWKRRLITMLAVRHDNTSPPNAAPRNTDATSTVMLMRVHMYAGCRCMVGTKTPGHIWHVPSLACKTVPGLATGWAPGWLAMATAAAWWQVRPSQGSRSWPGLSASRSWSCATALSATTKLTMMPHAARMAPSQQTVVAAVDNNCTKKAAANQKSRGSRPGATHACCQPSGLLASMLAWLSPGSGLGLACSKVAWASRLGLELAGPAASKTCSICWRRRRAAPRLKRRPRGLSS